MRNKNKFQEQHSKNYKRDRKSLVLRTEGLKPKQFLVLSLRFLDKSQGETPEIWEDNKILSKAINRFQGLCSMTVIDAKQQKILKIYGKQMPKDSNFAHPKYLDDDVEWASIRIQAKERIIGFLESGFIFHIVFFDMKHDFYPSKKKNT